MDNGNTVDRKEAEALMKRLEAQFGDVDLDLELLGLRDEEQVALELEEVEDLNAADADADADASVTVAQSVNSASTNKSTNQNDCIADAEAAALMARLGAQFGDLDMSQLGLGVGVGVGFVADGSNSSNNNHLRSAQSPGNSESPHNGSGRESDDESSLEDPTPEELEAWQASQFSRGQQKEATPQTLTGDSIAQRRTILREKRKGKTASETTILTGSVLDILGGDTSAVFGAGPSATTTTPLEELVSDASGDPEILRTSWKRLYASYEQGLGFWNLWRALKGYDGPTLLVLRCLPSASKTLGREPPSETACLGFYTTTPWKESSEMFGGDHADGENGDRAFLFTIDEKCHKTSNGEHNTKSPVKFFPVAPKQGKGGNYMYCQPSAHHDGDSKFKLLKTKSKTATVTGLGVGGRPTQPRFHLTETFEDCSCLTYDSSRNTRDGDLFACFGDDEGHSFAEALYCFDVIELEAWGVGGKEWIDHALQERERAEQQHILRYQKVDKQMVWDQGP